MDCASAIDRTLRSQSDDSKKLVIKGLPPLGAQLVSAIECIRSHTSTVNFAMVYEEYRENLRKMGFNGGAGAIQKKSVAKKVGSGETWRAGNGNVANGQVAILRFSNSSRNVSCSNPSQTRLKAAGITRCSESCCPNSRFCDARQRQKLIIKRKPTF